MRCLVVLALLAGCADGPPDIYVQYPLGDEDLDGVGLLNVLVNTDDRNGPVEIEVLADDGTVLGAASTDEECEYCVTHVEADVSAEPEGAQTLTVVATDRAGNAAEAYVPVSFADVLYVKQLEVTNSQEDGFNGPDIEPEMHLGNADEMTYIGCTGADTGMAPAVADDVRYDLGAVFVNQDWDYLSYDDVASLNLVIDAIENDGKNTACPSFPDLSDELLDDEDDWYGRSNTFRIDDMGPGDEKVLSFTGVPHLMLSVGRPRQYGPF